VRTLHEDIVPLLEVEFCDEEAHRAAMEAVLAAARRKLSLVDCLSFLMIRRRAVRHVFCFDAHFAEQGFDTTPPPVV
jgi:predicted nucleic acid-binding protein